VNSYSTPNSIPFALPMRVMIVGVSITAGVTIGFPP